MPEDSQPLILLSLVWLAYFAIHSLLAAEGTKAWATRTWPGAGRGYRLFFNGISTILLIPPVWLAWQAPGDWLWQWEGVAAWIANGLAVAALVAFVLTTRSYDTLDFLGLRQWREGQQDARDQAAFCLSDWHRFVRHPWYFLGLVVLWTRDMNPGLLVSAVRVTAYLLAGSRLEQRKLIAQYGEVYDRYRKRVPGLIPLPGRYLSRAEADELLASGGSSEPADR